MGVHLIPNGKSLMAHKVVISTLTNQTIAEVFSQRITKNSMDRKGGF